MRVHDVNETTADVRWNQPEQPERLKVKNEIIVRNETDMHTFMEDVQSGRQHVILRELTPITKYTVRVIAINVEQPEIQQSDMIRATSEPIEVVTTGPGNQYNTLLLLLFGCLLVILCSSDQREGLYYSDVCGCEVGHCGHLTDS